MTVFMCLTIARTDREETDALVVQSIMRHFLSVV